MGNSQSTNETDTTQLVLESDDEGKTKVTKRRLSREELDDLTEELNKLTDKNVTIDAEIYKSIGADLGITFEGDDEEEEEGEEDYYDEIEPYELVEPIRTPDNFSVVPGIDDISSVGPIELYPPPFIPYLQPEPEPVPEDEAVQQGVILESLPEPEPLAQPAAVEEPTVEEPAKQEPQVEERVAEEAVPAIEQEEVVEPTAEVEPIEEPVIAVEPTVEEIYDPAPVEVVEEPTIAPVVVEEAVAEIPAVVEEPTLEVVAVQKGPPIPKTPAETESTGLFVLIQKAIEPYFTTSTEVEAPTTKDVTPELESVNVIPEPESVATVVEPAAAQREPVEPTVIELKPTAPIPPLTTPPVEQVTPVTKDELPRSENLAQSLFGQFKKQEVEKIITEAKMEGARGQAKLDADVMSSALNAERSRWRTRFSVIESNLQKRKHAITSAHEEGVAVVTSKLELPKTQEFCAETVSEIVDCYRAHPDQTLRCNHLTQSFDSCVSNVLSSR